MKNTHTILIALSILMSGACQKEDDNTEDMPSTTISGIWKVDSMVTISESNYGMGTTVVTESNWPHFLDFSLPDFVIQQKFNNRDTTIFNQISAQYAISDLDFNGKTDTNKITILSAKKLQLQWISDISTYDTLQTVSSSTFYLSK